MAGTLLLPTQGALSYRLEGRPIPEELDRASH
jgi:hypothetical protein